MKPSVEQIDAEITERRQRAAKFRHHLDTVDYSPSVEAALRSTERLIGMLMLAREAAEYRKANQRTLVTPPRPNPNRYSSAMHDWDEAAATLAALLSDDFTQPGEE